MYLSMPFAFIAEIPGHCLEGKCPIGMPKLIGNGKDFITISGREALSAVVLEFSYRKCSEVAMTLEGQSLGTYMAIPLLVLRFLFDLVLGK